MGHTVSVGTICKVKKNMERPSLRVPANRKLTKEKATPRYIITKVAAMNSRVNPPTQREMATKLSICRIIRKVLNAKLRNKCKMHKISIAQVENVVSVHGDFTGRWKKRCDN